MKLIVTVSTVEVERRIIHQVDYFMLFCFTDNILGLGFVYP